MLTVDTGLAEATGNNNDGLGAGGQVYGAGGEDDDLPVVDTTSAEVERTADGEQLTRPTLDVHHAPDLKCTSPQRDHDVVCIGATVSEDILAPEIPTLEQHMHPGVIRAQCIACNQPVEAPWVTPRTIVDWVTSTQHGPPVFCERSR